MKSSDVMPTSNNLMRRLTVTTHSPDKKISNCCHFSLRSIAFLLSLITIVISTGCKPKPKTTVDAASIYLTQAETYSDLGQYQASIEMANKALRYNSSLPTARKLLANIYLTIDKPNLAIETLSENQEALKTESEYAILLVKAELASGKQAHESNLLSNEESILTDFPDHKNSLLANAELNAGNLENAKNLYKAAYTNTGNSEDLRGLIKTEIVTGNCEHAKQLIEANKESSIDEAYDLYFLGICQMMEEDFTTAELTLSNAISKLRATDTMTLQKRHFLNSLSSILAKQNKLSESNIYDQLFADAFPDFYREQVYLTKAVTLARKGNTAESIAILKIILPYATDEDSLEKLMYKTFIRHGKLGTAATYYKSYKDHQLNLKN